MIIEPVDRADEALRLPKGETPMPLVLHSKVHSNTSIPRDTQVLYDVVCSREHGTKRRRRERVESSRNLRKKRGGSLPACLRAPRKVGNARAQTRPSPAMRSVCVRDLGSYLCAGTCPMALRGSSDVLLARRHLVGSEFETPGAAAPGGVGVAPGWARNTFNQA